jgi:hypothetical protein
MKFEVGDVLVFTGNKTGDPHYNNFVVGQSYRIQDISVLYDTDSINVSDNNYVIFNDFKYGALSCYVPLHFEHLDDYRDEKLNQIL